jgi:hypothetical protein
MGVIGTRTKTNSVRIARERGKRLELENLSLQPCGLNESRPAELGQRPEASLAWWRGNPPCEA